MARLRVVGGIWWGGALAGDTAGIYFCAPAVLDLGDDRHGGAGHHGHERGDARELGHSYLRLGLGLGLGLGLFLPAHFLHSAAATLVTRRPHQIEMARWFGTTAQSPHTGLEKCLAKFNCVENVTMLDTGAGLYPNSLMKKMQYRMWWLYVLTSDAR